MTAITEQTLQHPSTTWIIQMVIEAWQNLQTTTACSVYYQ